MYPVATWIVKTAVGLMFVRIFARIWQAKVIYVTMAIYTAINFAYFFSIIFWCGNPAKWWLNIITQKCPSTTYIYVFSVVHGVATVLIDLVCLVIPWTYIRQANMDKRTKVSVGAILSIGSM